MKYNLRVLGNFHPQSTIMKLPDTSRQAVLLWSGPTVLGFRKPYLILDGPPVAAEDLPPWVFFVDHYSAGTAIQIPKADGVLALPSSFRSVIHPGDRGTPLPFWLLDLWRRLRNIHTLRSNVARGLEWLHEYGRQEEAEAAVFEVETAPLLDLPALLHPWCDLFSHLTTDDRDLNDELMDAVIAVVNNNTDKIPRPFHLYSAIMTQLAPVDLVDRFSKLADRGDFATDSIICLPWYIGGGWVFVLIDMASDTIKIGYCLPLHDQNGLLDIAKRTAIRIAHTVEVSVRQTRTNWILREHPQERQDQHVPIFSGLAIAVGLLRNVFDEVTGLPGETDQRHRLEIFFAIIEYHPQNPAILEDHKLSLWELQDTVRSGSVPATSDEEDLRSASPVSHSVGSAGPGSPSPPPIFSGTLATDMAPPPSLPVFRRALVPATSDQTDRHSVSPVLPPIRPAISTGPSPPAVFSRTLVPPLTVLSTSPPVFTRALEPPLSSSTGTRLSDLYGGLVDPFTPPKEVTCMIPGTTGIRLGRCASILQDTGASLNNSFHIAAGVHADTQTSVVFLDRPIKVIHPPRRAEPDGWCLVVLPPVHSYATAGALLQARLSTVGIHSEAHHARDCRTVSTGIQPKACHSVDTFLLAAGPPPAFTRGLAIESKPTSSQPVFMRTLAPADASPPAFIRQLARPPTPTSAPPVFTRTLSSAVEPMPPVFLANPIMGPTDERMNIDEPGDSVAPPAFKRLLKHVSEREHSGDS
ncbi:uncharacterized protein BXZ73DRAFT_111202 [Epithele typhae]|uniref:uncharacterized protein n=1 Tax=Epithele typhae TaxID=378194 RepID=UPI002008BE71|nr:uncharacterized protein BXZ73DRAFT_111202 [Epithele typhae]KAH9904618.1 hypothetical protein BXZ73DRAFT_111202 [Epithele typhae]